MANRVTVTVIHNQNHQVVAPSLHNHAMTQPLRHHLERELTYADSELNDGVVIIGQHMTCEEPGCENLAATIDAHEASIGDARLAQHRCPAHSKTPFTIDDDSKANWALHKIRAARRRIDEVHTLYEEELDRLNAFREHETRYEQQTIAFFEHHLVAYATRLRAADPAGRERTNHALPAGTIRFRRSQSVKVEDLDAVLAWAEQSHAELIERTVKIGEVRALLQKDGKDLVPVTTDGEKVPGIRIDHKLNSTVETS